MTPHIFAERGTVHLINVEHTRDSLARVIEFVSGLGASNKLLLFVGTKPQANSSIKAAAEACGQPYVIERWLGGTFTNFPVIGKLVRRLVDYERQTESGEIRRYTKYEQGKIREEILRLEKLVGGIRTMTRIPDAVFIVGMREESTAIREARARRVPIIAICDSNNDPTQVDYPIFANDDGVKCIELVTKIVTDAYLEGKAQGLKAKETPPLNEAPVLEESVPEVDLEATAGKALIPDEEILI